MNSITPPLILLLLLIAYSLPAVTSSDPYQSAVALLTSLTSTDKCSSIPTTLNCNESPTHFLSTTSLISSRAYSHIITEDSSRGNAELLGLLQSSTNELFGAIPMLRYNADADIMQEYYFGGRYMTNSIYPSPTGWSDKKLFQTGLFVVTTGLC